MVKPINRKWFLALVVLIMLVSTVLIGLNLRPVGAAMNEPGSIEDPLVSKSYVDAMMATLVKSEPIEPVQDAGSSQLPITFQVVTLERGQKLIAGAGTELIVRAGEAKAIGNTGGNGLSDVTIGKDILDGETIGNNHLLIVPRDDGRGLHVTSETLCYVMVKGAYTVE